MDYSDFCVLGFLGFWPLDTLYFGIFVILAPRHTVYIGARARVTNAAFATMFFVHGGGAAQNQANRWVPQYSNGFHIVLNIFTSVPAAPFGASAAIESLGHPTGPAAPFGARGVLEAGGRTSERATPFSIGAVFHGPGHHSRCGAQ